LAGAVLVGLIAAGELFARFGLGLGDPPLSEAHPQIEYLFKLDQGARRFGNQVFINAYGMRSPDFAPEKAPGELRVLVFGDSVLNGGNLSDQAELATSLLAELLGAVRDGPVSVATSRPGAGVRGIGSGTLRPTACSMPTPCCWWRRVMTSATTRSIAP